MIVCDSNQLFCVSFFQMQFSVVKDGQHIIGHKMPLTAFVDKRHRASENIVSGSFRVSLVIELKVPGIWEYALTLL